MPQTIAQDWGVCIIYGWTVVLVLGLALGLAWIRRR